MPPHPNLFGPANQTYTESTTRQQRKSDQLNKCYERPAYSELVMRQNSRTDDLSSNINAGTFLTVLFSYVSIIRPGNKHIKHVT